MEYLAIGIKRSLQPNSKKDARRAAKHFPPRTVLQQHKFEAQEYPMHYENAKKFERKVLIHFSLLLKETSDLLTREMPNCFVVELCG